jgi:hypothetical protein
MISRTVVVWLLLVIATILVSVQIGLKAEGLEDEIRAVKRAQEVERDRIRVLRASYAYLTAADQLKPLMERHLALEPVRGDQIMTLADLPRRVPVPTPKGSEPGAAPSVPVPHVVVPPKSTPRMAEAPPSANEEDRHGRSKNNTNPPWLKEQRNPVLQPVSLPSQER